jgi:hypothetical protein
MAETVLTLGDFVFQDMEIPERIPFGGEQRLVIKKLVGGRRVIDALGSDPIPLEWSGTFVGQDALARAQYVQGLKDAGLPLDLTWNELYYRVLIHSFVPDYQFYEIPYKISCEVLEDLTAPVADGTGVSIDDLITNDMSTANDLVSTVNDSTLTSLTGTLNSAVSAVSNFATATQSTINSVLQPLNAVKTQVQTLISSVDNTLINVTTLGGILPNNPLAVNVAKLTTQVNAALQQPALLNLQSVLGRMGTNLTQLNTSVRSITTSGGNLFDIAAKQYGDATGWTAIAAANGLKDPNLSGNTELVIPPYFGDSGGILYV